MPSPPDLPFISLEENIGDPPLSWEHFKAPKLRWLRAGEFFIDEYLGSGLDGMVFKATFENLGVVALKIFHDREKKEPDGIYNYHWAFERECINAALLEMIVTSIKRSRSNERYIYLHPRPTTRSHAMQNLKAFSDEGSMSRSGAPPENSQPFTEDVAINGCLGWLEVRMKDIMRDIRSLRQRQTIDCDDLPTSKRAFAIVYPFVPKETLEKETMISQANFFHLVGFNIHDVREPNWRGKGTLIDFSDLISPFERDHWDNHFYATHYNDISASVQTALDNAEADRWLMRALGRAGRAE